MRANMLAGGTGLLIVAGVTQSAHAEFTFHNDSSERVVFNLQCRNGSYETLSIDANRSQTYRCANGARDALLEVYTDDDSADDDNDDDDDDFLVSDQVYDAAVYAFFRDAVGYVEVVRFR
jgi:hypothetical protein